MAATIWNEIHVGILMYEQYLTKTTVNSGNVLIYLIQRVSGGRLTKAFFPGNCDGSKQRMTIPEVVPIHGRT